MLYFDNKIHKRTYISMIRLISLKKYIFILACELHFKNKLYGFQVSGHYFAVFITLHEEIPYIHISLFLDPLKLE